MLFGCLSVALLLGVMGSLALLQLHLRNVIILLLVFTEILVSCGTSGEMLLCIAESIKTLLVGAFGPCHSFAQFVSAVDEERIVKSVCSSAEFTFSFVVTKATEVKPICLVAAVALLVVSSEADSIPLVSVFVVAC